MTAPSTLDLDTVTHDPHNPHMSNWPMRSFAAPDDIWLPAADQARVHHVSVSHILREALKAYAATGKLATEK